MDSGTVEDTHVHGHRLLFKVNADSDDGGSITGWLVTKPFGEILTFYIGRKVRTPTRLPSYLPERRLKLLA